MAANEAGDAELAGRFAAEITRVAPNSFHSWFEAGLHAKARQEWQRCAEWNERAVELFGPNEAEEFDGMNPAAWNLGIAATALGDWALARHAWTAFGIDGVEESADPIDMSLGSVPIRINPDRPSLSLQVVPEYGSTEVVWCWRRSPAHAVIASVPLPESGHRFRDVILHDGEPKGDRQLGDSQVPVFDQLERLHDSQMPTWQAQVEGAASEDFAVLGDLAARRGLGADEWSGMNLLCSECSHGSPGTNHSHAPATEGNSILGLAGAESEVSQCLHEWRQRRSSVNVLAVDLLW